MTITANDIKLFESERLTQNPDGGGRMTGNEVIDGQVNNLFQDISRINRAYGSVHLIKAFLGVQTNTTDIYLGAHAALVRPPADDNVSAVVFTTESDTDLREDARDRIESYVVAGPEALMNLLGDQLEGQRSIQVVQRQEWPLPEVGQVYVLSEEDEQGEVTAQQYVRVRDVDTDLRDFSILRGTSVVTFTRRVVRLDLGVPLRRTFPGAEPTDADDDVDKPTLVRSTNVADAARYYGIATLLEEADGNTLELKVDDPYQQLVPVTQGTTPVTDVQAGGLAPVTVTSGGEQLEIQQVARTLEREITIANRDYSHVFLLQPIPAPGATVVEYRALGQWERLADDGTGTLVGAGTGKVDFGTGSVSVTLNALPDANTSILVYWAVPAFYTDRAGSVEIDPPEVVFTTSKAALPGSLSVSWVSGGDTYSVSDDGKGNLTGDGTGRVIYRTNHIISSGPNISGSTSGAGDAVPGAGGQLPREQVAEAVAEVALLPGNFPDANSEIVIDYDSGATVTTTFNPNKAGDGSVSVTVGSTPIKPGSVTLKYKVQRTFEKGYAVRGNNFPTFYETDGVIYTVQDDGEGGFPGLEGATVDYGTGDIFFYPELEYELDQQYPSGVTQTKSRKDTFADGSLVTVAHVEDSVTGTAESETATLPPVRFNFLPLTTDSIVPATLDFDWLGTNFTDRGGQGVIYDENGIVAGAVNYRAGEALLDNYQGGGLTNSITVNTLVSVFQAWTLDEVTFRTPGSPLQPGGFVIQATRFDTGDLITATADASGILDADFIAGEVDFDTGQASLRFGELVAESSLTQEEKSEPWYDPDDIDENGDIFKPVQVFPSTIRFNAVVYTILPLDADLIGLDPVRLPSDGRVPIFRPGYLLLVHHPQDFSMPNPLSAEQVVGLPRGSLSHVRMLDANDQPVPGGTGAAEDQWSLDKAAGDITIADSGTLDTTTYVEPWTAEHVVDDLVLAADVQIDGTIRIVGGLTHTFPANESYVSGVLVFGDLQARVTGFFEQETWQSAWADDVSGDQPDASYNLVTYPVEVFNANAITERWALVFNSTTGGEIIGETVGVLGTFSISGDVAPINPNTGEPYFIVRSDGFGAGWDPGNAIRFNTIGANAPMWTARTVLSGAAELEQDRFRLQLRGDAD